MNIKLCDRCQNPTMQACLGCLPMYTFCEGCHEELETECVDEFGSAVRDNTPCQRAQIAVNDGTEK